MYPYYKPTVDDDVFRMSDTTQVRLGTLLTNYMILNLNAMQQIIAFSKQVPSKARRLYA